MAKRYVSIWFRYLRTDWFTRRQPGLGKSPFVLVTPSHGRMVITAANRPAQLQGIDTGMVLADARALIPSLQVLDDKPELTEQLLNRIAEFCIRYTPVVAVDLPDGLILDATGCSHLWGGDKPYLEHIQLRFKTAGYHVRVAIADTIGAAWAIARYEKLNPVIEPGNHVSALLPLPLACLRIDGEIVQLLQKLGLKQVNDIIDLPHASLHRRFGPVLINRLKQALGHEEEGIDPVMPVEPYQERLPCLEPISTATGIEIALQRLLELVCQRLKSEQKGLRVAIFKAYRVDGKIESIQIATNRPSSNTMHLFKLFEIKLPGIEPALGIELFILEAPGVENISAQQQQLWQSESGLRDLNISELLDRFAGKFGEDHVHRYMPDEHYWPERSFRNATGLDELPETEWLVDTPRPMQLLSTPHPIDVTAPIPDYPPMLFRYKGKLHKISKADGPERIEQEWWLQQGQHRDYYTVEDENGQRYWLFRLGHYSDTSYKWFLHGFFP